MEHPERLGHGEHAHTTDASADRTEPQPEPDVEGKTPETGEFPLRLATNPRSSVVQPRRKQAYLARRWLAMGLATLALLALAIGVMARLPLPVSAAHLANARYGSNYQQMVNAVKAAQWPQQKSNWCGVASITAIIRYEGIGVTQGSMSSFLDSSAAVSTWGTPSNAPGYYGPGFAADISRDFGTEVARDVCGEARAIVAGRVGGRAPRAHGCGAIEEAAHAALGDADAFVADDRGNGGNSTPVALLLRPLRRLYGIDHLLVVGSIASVCQMRCADR